MDSLKFAIGGIDQLNMVIIRNILLSKGNTICCEEDDGASLLRKIRSMEPDFVIIGYNILGMNSMEIARIVQSDRVAPVLIIADSTLDISIRDMGDEYFPSIIKPISEIQLLTTIEFSYINYKRMVNLENQIKDLKNTLEERKIIEKAKGILIDSFKMKEKDAFRYIQKRSMDECKSAVDIAKRIINKYG